MLFTAFFTPFLLIFTPLSNLFFQDGAQPLVVRFADNDRQKQMRKMQQLQNATMAGGMMPMAAFGAPLAGSAAGVGGNAMMMGAMGAGYGMGMGMAGGVGQQQMGYMRPQQGQAQQMTQAQV